ncbi:energy transducer TonB [Tenacibaculum finnmarkense]|uniref:TonB family protein n=1 Tax=Tenacibaculum finnmarkense genomovar finnmarkense TaxID=1458503 RepID=A0AAP1WF17_9FLAO|nr:energy transducer TonB [Tenacibaculum finnmarkense]MBE7651816.1 TonB family protein [Tenacibaculum finnmarkense genomovar finnmarkense]MBE7693834.1 TonB family protein [Tenacibaculum finnmarkense genomovar finnmarkense]MCD8428135.1 energy transducer TonB [Tenacibaculum finnmarkense genomovar finnmarkense]MCG8731881.1 energy transducer TonB [Tenacibaculum finnmarkense]MCG8752378.1 energy transducer TonB [Tenacibaculum finnmarkense]
MKKLLVLILTVCLSINICAQKVCESSKEIVEDLNSISIAKCDIKKTKKKHTKKTREIPVTRRSLKKRKITKGVGVGIAKIHISPQNENQKLALEKEPSLGQDIIKITNKLSKEELDTAVKFNKADKIPLFNACKNVSKTRRAFCFNKNMVNHISTHFKYPTDAIRKSIQGNIWVSFIIDKNGEVKNIKTLVHKNGDLLHKEALRVVAKLPQFIPGKKQGKRVSVKYGFPISLALE